jgi:hypothetical protein
VRAIARKGTWNAGQYLMMFMNGCDTFAYVDGYMAQTRAAINHDDPSGSKYMDIVVNAMPAFFASDAGASMALINGLLAYANPKTYEEIFRNIDNSQVVLVSGEEDNVYFPGYGSGGGGTTGGGGMGTLVDTDGDADQGEDLAFETGTLMAGRYTVTLTGTTGDADLYVKAGQAPTHTVYDCRPYVGGSNESCDVTLTASAKIYMLVNGYAAGSNPFHIKVTGAAAPPPAVDLSSFKYDDTVAKSAEKRYQTATLPVGKYTFTMTGTGGDADLYVKTGAPPSTSSYECRPYASGSNETCTVTLNAAAPIHVMVRGYAASSTYHLVAKTGQ